jgi:uncharacterized protein (DUF924 family)
MNDQAIEVLPDEAIDVLEYWFGTEADDAAVAEQKSALWWGHAEETDAEIERRFGGLMEQAQDGELADWHDTPRGALALILLLDQFSRNVYRDTARMFAQDAAARVLTLKGLEDESVSSLRPIEQVFFLLPLEHSENLDHQNLMVERCLELAREVPEAWREVFENYVGFAEAHRKIIRRFGRFPHRNQILGRDSTSEEVEFLKEPGSSF